MARGCQTRHTPPGHDKFPSETYRSHRSKRARTAVNRLAHKRAPPGPVPSSTSCGREAAAWTTARAMRPINAGPRWLFSSCPAASSLRCRGYCPPGWRRAVIAKDPGSALIEAMVGRATLPQPPPFACGLHGSQRYRLRGTRRQSARLAM